MNVPDGLPMTPEIAARNRRIIVAVAVAFVLVSVSVSVWGYTVTRATRDRAVRTDAALRSVAWAILCYAAANHGAFPTSDAAIAAVPADAAPPAGRPWPSSLESAMGGLRPVPPDEALLLVGVTWGAAPEVAPSLNTKGNPSSFGAVDAVNGWFAEYARDRARQPGGTAPVRSK